MEKKLNFLPKFNAFGIADSEIPALELGQIPTLKFAGECYKKLGLSVPFGAPKVGFLLGREDSYYTIDYNYAYAVVKSGVEPVFLDYQNCTEQLAGCSGLILPGGAFQSPDWYYTDETPNAVYPNARSQAYAYALHTALAMGIPILGICAGAQVIAAEFGGHLDKSKKRPHHKTDNQWAHWVKIKYFTPLHNLLEILSLMTNSRHKESVRDLPTLDLYAETNDGVPEAWGSSKDKILCIQWHPEDYAAQGNLLHQKIYNWLAIEAKKYQTKL